jgi:hypothetical protein
MQITYLNQQEGADVLEQSEIVAELEAPGSSVTFLLVWDRRDVVMVADGLSGACLVIENDDVDTDRGGSAHSQARKALGGSGAEPEPDGLVV